MNNNKQVTITVDGACLGNGQAQTRAAAAAILNYRGHRRAVAEFIGQGTNQRAEIIAAACGLESLTQPCTVILRSDSSTWSKPWLETSNESEITTVGPDLITPPKTIRSLTSGSKATTVTPSKRRLTTSLVLPRKADKSILRFSPKPSHNSPTSINDHPNSHAGTLHNSNPHVPTIFAINQT